MKNDIITYLTALQKNNEKTWFHDHKKEYQEAQTQFLDLVERLQWEIAKFDEDVVGYEPSSLSFKLQRDTRFSNNKMPYLPAFRAHIGPKGKLPIPVGYYLMITPQGCFLGGGLFASCFSDATKLIRDAIVEREDEFARLLEDKTFQSYMTLQGESLQKAPKGYPQDHPHATYLKYKSWFLELPFEDTMLEDLDAFVLYATQRFQAMKPMHDFLNQALKDFTFPQR